jgi:N-acetyl-anhydromuramyl-L-alanine amidase AmpD
MYLTQLADIARHAGLTVVEQYGWRTRGHGEMSDVRAIVCHYTAGGAGNEASLEEVQNGRPDLAGPLAHFLLAKDGTAHVVAAGLCYHAGAVLQPGWGNAHAIGIEAERSFADIGSRVPWPARQMDAYARLARALADAYGAQVLGHKEVCAPPGRKIDPDFDMAAFRTAVARVGTSGEDEDMTPDQSRKLDEVIEQLTGSREADKYVIRLAKAHAGLEAKVDKLIELLTPKTGA